MSSAGEALADLPGPVKALRKTPPPARRGFTVADQVNQLVSASEADPSRASDKRTVDAFRTDCLRELKKIKLAWPELNYFTPKGVLILSPSEPSIPRLSTGGISRQGF